MFNHKKLPLSGQQLLMVLQGFTKGPNLEDGELFMVAPWPQCPSEHLGTDAWDSVPKQESKRRFIIESCRNSKN